LATSWELGELVLCGLIPQPSAFNDPLHLFALTCSGLRHLHHFFSHRAHQGIRTISEIRGENSVPEADPSTLNNKRSTICGRTKAKICICPDIANQSLPLGTLRTLSGTELNFDYRSTTKMDENQRAEGLGSSVESAAAMRLNPRLLRKIPNNSKLLQPWSLLKEWDCSVCERGRPNGEARTESVRCPSGRTAWLVPRSKNGFIRF
jgi:hypothetical protein